VLVSILRTVTPGTAELDAFLMSCRVLGRFVEDQILDHLVRELRADGFSRLRVKFIPTAKNVPARAFIERLQGGRMVSDGQTGAQTWEFDISETSPVTKPAYAELLTKSVRAAEVVS
jgi:predicted enzyme involved in methoxymalonyl-ACP biosynthesis